MVRRATINWVFVLHHAGKTLPQPILQPDKSKTTAQIKNKAQNTSRPEGFCTQNTHYYKQKENSPIYDSPRVHNMQPATFAKT
jgi:hypothetical protein